MSTNGSVKCGGWLDGYQAQAQAPVEFIQGSRSRPLDGHLITGSWSDPWWMYSPEQGWAVAKRWKNKEQPIFGWQDRRSTVTSFPARDEIVVTPWPGGHEGEAG